MISKKQFLTITILLLCALLATCVAAPADAQTYTVQADDTLAQIAQAHDTTVEELVALNKDAYPSLKTDPSAIEVGWTLKLPGGKDEFKLIVNTPSIGSGPTAVPLDRDAFEAEVLRLVNEERAKTGLAPLQAAPGLMEFARQRSEDMVARAYFSHKDPETRQDLTPDAGENITKLLYTINLTDQSASRALLNWMSSEGHRNNILDSGATQTGVGVAIGDNYVIVTQLFK